MVFSLRACGGDQPADGQRLAALGAHFDRHLIGRTTNTARANFNRGATFSSA
jgi:hypothetical protein